MLDKSLGGERRDPLKHKARVQLTAEMRREEARRQSLRWG
jgi:hypothetical protein